MTKVTVDGKEYCVETLLFNIERLKKDAIVGGEALMKLTKIRVILNECENNHNYDTCALSQIKEVLEDGNDNR